MSQTIERLCVFCKHFNIDFGTSNYSDLTPGEPAEIGCKAPEIEKQWIMTRSDPFHEKTEEAFRKNLETFSNSINRGPTSRQMRIS